MLHCSSRRGSPTRPWAGVLWLLIFVYTAAGTALAGADNGAARPATPATRSSAPVIVVGFVGGFVGRDDLRHSEVQLVHKLRATHPDHLRVAIFENRRWKAAHQAILRWLDTDEDGNLSDAEKRGARIVLFGHSWGGAAVIALARELQREGIPVLLTVQVDSIAKPGQDDRVVPANVAKAANFYQSRGLLRGRPRITAADPASTQILGDFLFNYSETPAECRAYPWLARHLFREHIAIECDPQVWSQVENLISKYSIFGDAESLAELH